jgi:hypothetical protein
MKNLLPIRLLDPTDSTQNVEASDHIIYDGSVFTLLETNASNISALRYLVDISYDMDSGLLFARFSDHSEIVLSDFLTLDDINLSQRGKRGDIGKKGKPGDKALDGRSGRPGMQGCVGIRGDRGYKGMSGNQGSVGLVGDKGITGLIGEVGEKGYKGLTGSVGSAGYRGKTGLQGYPGNRGITGLDGDQGYKGRDGPVGCKGEIGQVGSQGRAGDMGKQGEGGEPNMKAINGLPGPDGKDGEPSPVKTLVAGDNVVVSLVRGTEYLISADCRGCSPITLPPDCTTAAPTTAPGSSRCGDTLSYTGTGPKVFNVFVGTNTGELNLEYAVAGDGTAIISMEAGTDSASLQSYLRGSGVLTMNKTSSTETLTIRILTPSFSPAPPVAVTVQMRVNCLGGDSGCPGGDTQAGFGSYDVDIADRKCCLVLDWGGYTGQVLLRINNPSSTYFYRYYEGGREEDMGANLGGMAAVLTVSSNGRLCFQFDDSGGHTFTATVVLAPYSGPGGTTQPPINPVLVGTLAVSGLSNCSSSLDMQPSNAASFYFPKAGRYRISYSSGAVNVNSVEVVDTWKVGQLVFSNILPARQCLGPTAAADTYGLAVSTAQQQSDSYKDVEINSSGVYYFWVHDINCPDNSNDSIIYDIYSLG